MDEVIENEVLPKAICVGHFLLWSFTKKAKDFVKVYKMITELFTKNNVVASEVQEGVMVALANFYDTLIDNPNSPEQLKEMLETFEQVKILDKDFILSVEAHIEEMKKQLDEEYAE